MTACDIPDQTPLLYVPVTREELEAILQALGDAEIPYILSAEELKLSERFEYRAHCLLDSPS